MVTVFIVKCFYAVSHLSEIYEHDLRIGSLLELSAHIHNYDVRDKNGMLFGEHMRRKHNLLYGIAAFISFKAIGLFPVDDYDITLIFPVCAKTNSSFNMVLDDLRDPERLLGIIGHDYIPSPKYERKFEVVKEYFHGDIIQMRNVEIYFISDCMNDFRCSDSCSVVERLNIPVPMYRSLGNI